VESERASERRNITHAVAAPADKRAAAANLKETMVATVVFAGPFLPPLLQKSDESEPS